MGMIDPVPDLNAMTLDQLHDQLVREGLVARLFELSRLEDLGPSARDATSLAVVDGQSKTHADIVARQPGIASGIAFVGDLLDTFAHAVLFRPRLTDGQPFDAGHSLGSLLGPTRQILAAERTLLNMLGRMCGIATRTAAFIDAMGSTDATLYDTRKTTPGMRALEKYAVRCGGGFSHRMGLHDAVLIKDNHLAGIPPDTLKDAITRFARAARADDQHPAFVEVEADSLEQLTILLAVEPGLIDIILLDNIPPAALRDAVALRDQHNPDLALEASGGITLDTIGAVAATGVERISCGSITHGATWIDLGLDIGPDTPSDAPATRATPPRPDHP